MRDKALFYLTIKIIHILFHPSGTAAPVVYSLTGEMLEVGYARENGKFILYTNRIAAGVYFVHFYIEGVSVNMKFVKLD